MIIGGADVDVIASELLKDVVRDSIRQTPNPFEEEGSNPEGSYLDYWRERLPGNSYYRVGYRWEKLCPNLLILHI